MISFPSYDVDEALLYELAQVSFLRCAKRLVVEDSNEFSQFFGKWQLVDLDTALTKVQYTKYIRGQDLIFFDQSTEFHIEVKLNIFVKDKCGDKVTLAGYLLVLNSDLEPVDDFLL